MFAVIKTGGKQYKVAENDILVVEKLNGAEGEIIELGDVLLVQDDDKADIGGPTVSGATVAAEIIDQGRGEKIIVFKKKRRKRYRRTHGHRQHQTVLRVTEILTGGKKPSKKAADKKPTPKAGKPAAEKAEKPAAKEPAGKKPAAKAAAPAKAKTSPKPKAEPKSKPAAKKTTKDS